MFTDAGGDMVCEKMSEVLREIGTPFPMARLSETTHTPTHTYDAPYHHVRVKAHIIGKYRVSP